MFFTFLEESVILIRWSCSWDSSRPGFVGFIAAYAISYKPENHQSDTDESLKIDRVEKNPNPNPRLPSMRNGGGEALAVWEWWSLRRERTRVRVSAIYISLLEIVPYLEELIVRFGPFDWWWCLITWH